MAFIDSRLVKVRMSSAPRRHLILWLQLRATASDFQLPQKPSTQVAITSSRRQKTPTVNRTKSTNKTFLYPESKPQIMTIKEREHSLFLMVRIWDPQEASTQSKPKFHLLTQLASFDRQTVLIRTELFCIRKESSWVNRNFTLLKYRPIMLRHYLLRHMM